MLEFGPTYELTKSPITSKLNRSGVELEDSIAPALPVGTRFTVFDWNEWEPYSEQLKLAGKDPYFYAIRLQDEFAGSRQYLALAQRLEQDSRQV
jgi:hypothetical protein